MPQIVEVVVPSAKTFHMPGHEKVAASMFAAAANVFDTMLGLKLTLSEEPVVICKETNGERVSTLVGLVGACVGTGMATCSPELACLISSHMLMAEYPHVSSEVLDAMGEIANMIFGNVKTDLEDDLGPLGLSIPTVIFGRNFSTRIGGEQSWIVVPAYCETYPFELRICLNKA